MSLLSNQNRRGTWHWAGTAGLEEGKGRPEAQGSLLKVWNAQWVHVGEKSGPFEVVEALHDRIFQPQQERMKLSTVYFLSLRLSNDPGSLKQLCVWNLPCIRMNSFQESFIVPHEKWIPGGSAWEALQMHSDVSEAQTKHNVRCQTKQSAIKCTNNTT